MIIKTKDFKEAANTILLAVDLDRSAANLEICTKNGDLYLNVTNREYYVSVKFPLDATDIEFKAVVEAPAFLNLISGLAAETFELNIVGNGLEIKADRSKYKLPMVFEGDKLIDLPPILLNNVTVDMPISLDILKSILDVNSRELQKLKKMEFTNELQKLYYIDETGCFTFTTGACLNAFSLAKPIKLLLNDRIIRLFKLFKDNVDFKFGYDPYNGITQTKAVFQTPTTYVAALITCDDVLINKVQAPCLAAKSFVSATYENRVVVSANALSAAIARLVLFTKNLSTVSSKAMLAKIGLIGSELIIKDEMGNTEAVTIENGSYVPQDFVMTMDITDLKLALDSYKNEHVTISCGSPRSVIINCGNIHNILPRAMDAGVTN